MVDFIFKILFIYFWLCWVFIAAHELPLVAKSRTTLHWWRSGFSLGGFSSCGALVIVMHRHSCLMASGIFPDQGLNLCPLHWQVDS